MFTVKSNINSVLDNFMLENSKGMVSLYWKNNSHIIMQPYSSVHENRLQIYYSQVKIL